MKKLNYGDTFYIAGIKFLKVYNPYKYPDCRSDEDSDVELHDPDDNTYVELNDSDNDTTGDE